MLKIVDDPWKTLARAAKTYDASRADVLTGYIGGGAHAALTTLGLRARIIVGLAAGNAGLSETQVGELKRLAANHQVRWLPGLHAKLYLLDERVVLVGSANLTRSGFETLDEILITTDDVGLVREAKAMFAARWKKANRLDPSKLTILRTIPDSSSGPEGGLGIAKTGVKSAFSSAKRARGTPGAAPALSSEDGVRLLAAWPQWISELEALSSIKWTTSMKSPKGQVHLLAITKTGEGLEEYAGDRRVDAVHSLWRTTERAKRVRAGRWPIQANFKKVLVLDKPVPKADLVAAGLIKGGWPQHAASGKIFRKEALLQLADVLAIANPRQENTIRTVLSSPAQEARSAWWA